MVFLDECYKVLVRHFIDKGTGADNTGEVNNFVSTAGSDYANVYPASNRAQNYLGRYSVLRNTWYTININSVLHIGSTTPPSITDIPDDEVAKYLSTRINVTRWAKRPTQDADLK